MRRYDITITLRDGSQGHHSGIYSDGFAATIAAMEAFPSAMRITARRLA